MAKEKRKKELHRKQSCYTKHKAEKKVKSTLPPPITTKENNKKRALEAEQQ
jgi:hypothetical protein